MPLSSGANADASRMSSTWQSGGGSAPEPCAAGSIASTATTSCPAVAQRGVDPGSDEAGRARQQNPHGRSKGSWTPSCGRQCVHVRSSGDLLDGLVHELLERHQVALELGEHVDRPHTGAGLDACVQVVTKAIAA